MRFQILGPVVAAAARQPADLGRGHQRTILAVLLAARGDVVTTDRLVGALWEQDPPPTARKSLQSHVSRLRHVLQELAPATSSPVQSTGDGYRIDLDGHECDAVEFESLASAARAVVRRAPDEAIPVFERALDLWRGRAFGDLADHPALRAEAVRLEQLRLSAATELVDARLLAGEHDEVLAELERTIAEEPLDERAHGQLMVAQYRGGRQVDALATFATLRERLRDHLGVDPSPQMRQLHERILRHDPGLARPAGRAVSPHGAAPQSRGESVRDAPVAASIVVPDLVGRQGEVSEVAARIEPGCLVTLTGPGGVGKTRLAEQVAVEVAGAFDDGMVMVGLAAVRDLDRVGDALITALGIQPTGERPPAETLVVALGERHLLLLLDNCEHLLDTVAPLVATIVGRCPNVAVLATSRERLGLTGERLWPVAPLPVPREDAGPEDVSAAPAGALFALRAAQADPSFALTDANAPAVAELCRRLDGMPLAIELAAARVRALDPEDLVARLDQRFTLLAGGPRHESGRHRTLQAVVAWSYELLSPVEACLFDRLSVFAGAFSLASVEEVCAGGEVGPDVVAGLLGELVDKSMVVAERLDGGVRYRLLDTLREFGARRLEDRDDPIRWRRAHAHHHVEVAAELGPQVRGPDESAAVRGLHAVFDDLRSAHAWFVEQGDVDRALRIPAVLGDYLFYRLRDEVTTWARRSVAMPEAAKHPAYAAALTTAAYGATSRAECGLARHQADEALGHGGDGLAEVWAVAALGTAALYDGHLEDLLDHARRITQLAERLRLPFYLAYAGVLRVLAHTYRDEPGEAFAALADLDDAAATSGSPTMQAFARYCRGEALLDTQPVDAADALEEAIRLARGVDNALIEGVSMVSLASLRGRLGETGRALRQFRDVVAHWRRLGDHTHQLTTLRNLVVLLVQLEEDETAALLHGAVTAGPTPSFGLEAQRLDDARTLLQQRLGSAAFSAASRRGRSLSPTQMGAVALQHLDALTSH